MSKRGRPGPKPQPYLWRDQVYYGLQAVADEAGVGKKAVHNHLVRHGHLDRLRTKAERAGAVIAMGDA